MDLDDFSSKDLARIEYLIDLGLKKDESKAVDYKKKLQLLIKDLEKLINLNEVEETEREYKKKVDETDQKIIWKVKLLHEQRHKEELEEAEDKEDWDN